MILSLILSFGDRFNVLIDDLISASWRFLELPLFLILIALLAIYFCVLLLLKKGERRSFYFITFLLFLFSFAFITDHKITNSLNEIRSTKAEKEFPNKSYSQKDDYLSEVNIELKISEIRSVDEWMENIKSKASKKGISLDQCLRDNAIFVLEEEHRKKLKNQKVLSATSFTIEEKLRHSFGELLFKQESLHKSIDYYHIRINHPKQDLHVATVNLRDSEVKINITAELKGKILTSDFAKSSQSLLAINGEAGSSAQKGSGFGPWVGNWVSEGKAIMLKDNDERPFICLNRRKEAMYFPEEIVDTILTKEKYNCIYGRFDVLLNGQNLELESKYRQPRTLLGLNAQGNQLILMVVDGRRPSHSIGMGLYRAAHIMQIFGAYNAMSCDQGGSSCMYIEGEGIVNIPADDGRERPVYSHIGIGLN